MGKSFEMLCLFEHAFQHVAHAAVSYLAMTVGVSDEVTDLHVLVAKRVRVQLAFSQPLAAEESAGS